MWSKTAVPVVQSCLQEAADQALCDRSHLLSFHCLEYCKQRKTKYYSKKLYHNPEERKISIWSNAVIIYTPSSHSKSVVLPDFHLCNTKEEILKNVQLFLCIRWKLIVSKTILGHTHFHYMGGKKNIYIRFTKINTKIRFGMTWWFINEDRILMFWMNYPFKMFYI